MMYRNIIDKFNHTVRDSNKYYSNKKINMIILKKNLKSIKNIWIQLKKIDNKDLSILQTLPKVIMKIFITNKMK